MSGDVQLTLIWLQVDADARADLGGHVEEQGHEQVGPHALAVAAVLLRSATYFRNSNISVMMAMIIPHQETMIT